MNELTKEASKQTILEAISFLWLGGRGRVRKSLRTQEKPLKGCFEDYTSEFTDVSSPCERLPDAYQAFLDSDRPKYVQPGGIDVASFREWCKAVDNDEKEIKKWENSNKSPF